MATALTGQSDGKCSVDLADLDLVLGLCDRQIVLLELERERSLAHELHLDLQGLAQRDVLVAGLFVNLGQRCQKDANSEHLGRKGDES